MSEEGMFELISLRYAVVDPHGRVTNVVLWDGESAWRPPIGCVAIPCPDDVQIGWVRDGDEWKWPHEPDMVNVAPEE